jgi:ABC-2 type transport system ATP-binding protein
MIAAMKVSNASKSFGRKKVIDNVSFEIYPGEVFGFLGPNGAGKTTMIKMIMGFLSMDEGSVEIGGFDKDKHYEKAMSSIGGIVENPEMYKDMTGRQNLQMYARLQNNISKARVDEVLSIVGMQDRANDKVKKYSLGMKQRIGVAQAMVHNPRVLILDEPTNGLDPAGIHELRDILTKLAHEEQVAVMVSSHLLSEMQMMCDRVGIIDKGRLIDIKTMEDLRNLSGGPSTQRIKTTRPQEAIEILKNVGFDKIVGTSDSEFDLQIENKDIPQMIKALVEGGIDIYGVSLLESTLEEAFLRITGGGITIE